MLKSRTALIKCSAEQPSWHQETPLGSNTPPDCIQAVLGSCFHHPGCLLHNTGLTSCPRHCLAEYEESEEDIEFAEGAGPHRGGRRRSGRAPRRRRNRWEHGSVKADSPGHALNVILCVTATVERNQGCAVRAVRFMPGLPPCQQQVLPAAVARLPNRAVTASGQCCLSNCLCGIQ